MLALVLTKGTRRHGRPLLSAVTGSVWTWSTLRTVIERMSESEKMVRTAETPGLKIDVSACGGGTVVSLEETQNLTGRDNGRRRLKNEGKPGSGMS